MGECRPRKPPPARLPGGRQTLANRTPDNAFLPSEGFRDIEDIPCAILLSAPEKKFGDVFFVDRINTIYRMNG
jgi:hypothetical protein